MTGTDIVSDERSQAFTLEGFISAIVILTAVLFALQAVVITPTTGGAVDRSAQAQEQQEVRDVLVIAGENGNLSELVRNWNTGDNKWNNSTDYREDAAYNASDFAQISHFGKIMDEQFVTASGKSYNVDFIVTNEDEQHVEPIVRMGGGTGDSVVSASYTVTIHKNQNYTDGSVNNISTDRDYPFHPDKSTTPTPPESSEYTVVEVRVTVW